MNSGFDPAPVGTSIQMGADMLMTLIESECTNTAATARDQLRQFKQYFSIFRQQAMTMHAAEMAEVTRARQKLTEMQNCFAQSQRNHSLIPLSLAEAPSVSWEGRNNHEEIHINPNHPEASLAKQYPDELHSVPGNTDAMLSAQNGSPTPGANWKVILAEIGIDISEGTNLGILLGRLTSKSQHDQEVIKHLEHTLLASDKAQQQLINRYETEMTALKHEISMLKETIASQFPAQARSTSPPSGSQLTTVDNENNMIPEPDETLDSVIDCRSRSN